MGLCNRGAFVWSPLRRLWQFALDRPVIQAVMAGGVAGGALAGAVSAAGVLMLGALSLARLASKFDPPASASPTVASQRRAVAWAGAAKPAAPAARSPRNLA
jgi:NAD(P)H-dependent flavin oxidoreductase YrpB (nitropropane dioxygenase family)